MEWWQWILFVIGGLAAFALVVKLFIILAVVGLFKKL